MNTVYLLTFVVFIFAKFQNTNAFAECSGSGLSDPTIPGVNDCVSWAAFIQTSTSQSFSSLCSSNSSLAIKCCWTCQSYASFTPCTNIASSSSCQTVAQTGTCSQLLANNLPKSYYCAASCGTCSVGGPQCSSLPSNVCGPNGVCTTVSYFNISMSVCTCKSGFFGANCSRTDICLAATNPCQNGAICQSSNDADLLYTCACSSGCAGKNCNQCGCSALGSFSCVNGGTCQLATGVCICPLGYSGSTCSTFQGCRALGSFSCLNGGLCLNTGSCQCTTGWSGSTCSIGQGCNAAGSMSCANGGSCIQQSGLCQCASGWSGSNCMVGLGCNAGGSQSCSNGGVCVQSTGVCQCSVGFSGSQCQIGTACSSNPCQNGAVCTVSGSNAVCTCRTGFYGFFCNSQSACASPSPCQNNGTCTNQLSSPFYSCQCPPNFFGVNCQVRLTGLTCSASDTNAGLCALWKSLGFCSYSYLYQSIPVPVYCPQQCSLCSSVNSCQDQDKNCPVWAQRNLCPFLQQLNLLSVCRLSCNACPLQSKRSIINLDGLN